LSVLVVEDQSLIAMDIEETLTRLGVTEVLLASTTDAAFALLRETRPRVAILDFNLRGGATSERVADSLLRDGVPFLFATGYGDNVMIPPRFAGVDILRKPVNAAQLAAALHAAVGGAAERSPPRDSGGGGKPSPPPF
jgi:CheY-like chemotaxis protein